MEGLGLTILTLCLCGVFGQDPIVDITETQPASVGKYIWAKRDEDVTLTCAVENKPLGVNVRWIKTFKDMYGQIATKPISQHLAVEDNIKHGIEQPTPFTWRLRVRAIQISDEANYTCRVPTGSHGRTRVEDFRIVRVLVPPFLKPERTSTDMTISEGDNVDLMCFAEGKPEPMVEWSRLGNALLPVGQEKYMGSLLAVTNVRAEHRGKYRCRVWNSIGEVTRVITLGIKFKPKITAPNVVKQAPGYLIELQCLAEANPFPREDEIQWVKNAATMSTSSGRFEINVIEGAFGRLQYEMIIHGVKEEDYGDYMCKIRNAEGMTLKTIRLEKTDIPQPSFKRGIVINSASSVVMQISTVLSCILVVLLHYT